MLVYICHPYTSHGDIVENYLSVTTICRKLRRINVTPVSPIHAFYFIFNPERERVNSREFASINESVMEYCLELLDKCDQVWCFKEWDKSKGCIMEVNKALKNKIPVYEAKTRGGIVYELKEINWKRFKKLVRNAENA